VLLTLLHLDQTHTADAHFEMVVFNGDDDKWFVINHRYVSNHGQTSIRTPRASFLLCCEGDEDPLQGGLPDTPGVLERAPGITPKPPELTHGKFGLPRARTMLCFPKQPRSHCLV